MPDIAASKRRKSHLFWKLDGTVPILGIPAVKRDGFLYEEIMSTIEQYQPGLNEAGAYFDLRQQVFAYELAEAGVIDDRIQSLMRYRTQEGYEQGMREVINDPSRQFIGMRDEQGLI